MRLTKEQVNKIKVSYEQGVKVKTLAKEYGVSIQSIKYWTTYRDKVIKRNLEYYKKKTPEEKRAIYERDKKYRFAYFKKRYHNDSVFREKHKKRCRKIKEKL